MSIMYCEKHDRRFDTDLVEECPKCARLSEDEEELQEAYDCPIHGNLGGVNHCPRC